MVYVIKVVGGGIGIASLTP
nr:hypothetical protein [Vibrio floridensis]